jgi:hypothetical protein
MRPFVLTPQRNAVRARKYPCEMFSFTMSASVVPLVSTVVDDVVFLFNKNNSFYTPPSVPFVRGGIVDYFSEHQGSCPLVCVTVSLSPMWQHVKFPSQLSSVGCCQRKRFFLFSFSDGKVSYPRVISNLTLRAKIVRVVLPRMDGRLQVVDKDVFSTYQHHDRRQ